MDKLKNKYRIPAARLQNWDDGSVGMYFITICTKNRNHVFGKIETLPNHFHCMLLIDNNAHNSGAVHFRRRYYTFTVSTDDKLTQKEYAKRTENS